MTPGTPALEYVVARRALLDVLELLEPQRNGLILVGAQAVYLRAPAEAPADLAYTTDGDLAIDPDLLSPDPDIGALLLDSGYERLANPGSFLSPDGVEIDLMVPDGALAPSSHRRSAPLNGQSRFTGRRTAGLEVALVDFDRMRIGALEESDERIIEVPVAGAAALTVAKLIKLEERLRSERPGRIVSKDAGDLLRLLRYCDATAIGARLAELSRREPALSVIDRAVSFLRAELDDPSSRLLALTVEARLSVESEHQVAAAIRTLGRRLSDAFRMSG